MNFDELIMLGTQRMLDRSEVDAYCSEQGIPVPSWLVAYGHVVAASFLEHSITWDEASSALNSIWPAVVRDDELTPFFFDVYLAFEDAETLDTSDARSAFSRHRLIEMRLLPESRKRKA